jgi:hypothetical protein
MYGEEEKSFIINYFWMKRWGAKTIHQELATTLMGLLRPISDCTSLKAANSPATAFHGRGDHP